MLSFMHAQYSLFQQGYNLLDAIDPYMKKLAAEVSTPSVCRQCPVTRTHVIPLVIGSPVRDDNDSQIAV